MEKRKLEIVNENKFYIVETPKKITVTNSLKKAERKARAFEAFYGLHIKIKIFEQQSLFDFIEQKFKEKPIFLEPEKEKSP